MSEQLGLFAPQPAPAPAAPAPAAPHSVPRPDSSPCPCCGWPVAMDPAWVATDALCWRCRDIDDPRLSRRARAARYGRGQELCCEARARGEVRHDPHALACSGNVAQHVPPFMRGRFGMVRLDPKSGRPLRWS